MEEPNYEPEDIGCGCNDDDYEEELEDDFCPQCGEQKYNPDCQYCNENRYLPPVYIVPD